MKIPHATTKTWHSQKKKKKKQNQGQQEWGGKATKTWDDIQVRLFLPPS